MKKSSGKRSVLLRLIHDGKQPGQAVPEPVHFGLQDLKGEVHLGHPGKGSVLWFDFFVEFKGKEMSCLFSVAHSVTAHPRPASFI